MADFLFNRWLDGMEKDFFFFKQENKISQSVIGNWLQLDHVNRDALTIRKVVAIDENWFAFIFQTSVD